jgi:hypothetical protein
MFYPQFAPLTFGAVDNPSAWNVLIKRQKEYIPTEDLSWFRLYLSSSPL